MNFSAATLERDVSHFGAPLGSLPPLEVDPTTGRKIVRGLKIFKTGTFKDSKGRQRTWTPEDLQAMADNFTRLRDQGVLVDVPVREDHSTSVKSVQGYFTGVHSDGKFLYADVEFTKAAGAEQYENGTYRSRSIEISPYETNGEDPETHYPVVTGLAFVDIGAVEGLYRHGGTNPEEVPVADKPAATFRVRGVETTNADDVQAYIAELEKGSTVTFRMNGSDESDFAKVQNHIATLEQFRTESLENGRMTFVDRLVTENKLMASQADAEKAFVKCLPGDAYEAYVTSKKDAPVIGIFNRQTGDGDGRGNEPVGAEDQLAIHRETVAMHRRTDMAVDALKKTTSYQALVRAGEETA